MFRKKYDLSVRLKYMQTIIRGAYSYSVHNKYRTNDDLLHVLCGETQLDGEVNLHKVCRIDCPDYIALFMSICSFTAIFSLHFCCTWSVSAGNISLFFSFRLDLFLIFGLGWSTPEDDTLGNGFCYVVHLFFVFKIFQFFKILFVVISVLVDIDELLILSHVDKLLF